MEHELRRKLPIRFRETITEADFDGLEEIRFRAGSPPELCYAGDHAIRKNAHKGINVTAADIHELLNYLTGYSLYAYEEEIRQGYFTIAGGHRIGVAGRTSLKEEGGDTGISAMTEIGAVNIRIAHEHKGCALPIMPYIRREQANRMQNSGRQEPHNGADIYNTLLLAPPGVGKTTYLRDCIRLLSSGADGGVPFKVSVVDERSEIAACHLGEPQNDLGPRTDVLDSCPKRSGMRMLLRSMSPRIIAVDELGGEEDFRTLYEVLYSGSRILGTVHAATVEELRTKPCMQQLLEQEMIRRLILLEKDGSGRSFRVYDSHLKMLIR